MCSNFTDKKDTIRGFHVPERFKDFPQQNLASALEKLLFYTKEIPYISELKNEKQVYKRFHIGKREEELISQAVKIVTGATRKDVVILSLYVFLESK